MKSDISTKAGSSERGADVPLTAIVTRRQARQQQAAEVAQADATNEPSIGNEPSVVNEEQRGAPPVEPLIAAAESAVIPGEAVKATATSNGAINADDDGWGVGQLGGDSEDISNLFDIRPPQLVELQRTDPTLADIFNNLDTRAPDAANCYRIDSKNGLLMRVVCVNDSEGVEGSHRPAASNPVAMQIVVPYCLRTKLLNLAHALPVHGHQGIKKTTQRLTRYFFWPKIYSNVKSYCMSCDACQKLNKGGLVNEAPMMTPPIIDEPFKRLSIDVVTSLPLTEAGNRVIIVIVDHGTRWAECYARPNHTAKTVAKCVADFMTHYGVAEEILHDLGADFTSELFQVSLNYFGVDPLQCSIAHPQTNTAVERTNGTIKNMLRTFIAQHTEDWDEGPMFWMLCLQRIASR
jgi:hypothetical protein